MIRHIVMWTLAAEDAAQRQADAEGIKARLEALPGLGVEALRIEVGIDLGEVPGNAHVVLDSDFASRAQLAAYQEHPEHVAVGAFIKSVVASRTCVDFEH